MQNLSSSTIQKYIRSGESESKSRISHFIPIRSGSEMDKIPTQLNKFMRYVEDNLSDELNAKMRKKILKNLRSAHEEINNNEFNTAVENNTIATFVDEDSFENLMLPYMFISRCGIGTVFHSLPLIPLLDYNIDFFILSVHKESTRLFMVEGGKCELHQTWDNQITDDEIRNTGTRSHTRKNKQRRAPDLALQGLGYAGHFEAHEKNELMRFYNYLDDKLRILEGKIVLSGSRECADLMREVCSNLKLSEATAKEGDSDPDIKSCRHIIDKEQEEASKRNITRGYESDRIVKDIASIYKASSYGYVESIILPTEFSAIDSKKLRFNYQNDQFEGGTHYASSGLIEQCLSKTIQHGGRAIAINRNDVTKDVADSNIFAVLRCPKNIIDAVI